MKYNITDVHQFNNAGIGEQVHILRDTILQRLRIEEPTLRDQFAMSYSLSLADFKIQFGITEGSNEYIMQRYCIARYQYADAMLKARRIENE